MPRTLEGPLSRRAALGLAAAAPLALLAACRGRGGEAPGTEVALADLPEGRRVRVMRGEEPVELLRSGDSVTARSLWCTHLGCEVRWNEAEGSYDCPCHDGRFDAAGRVLTGPPGHGLRVIPVEFVGDHLVLPPPPAAASG